MFNGVEYKCTVTGYDHMKGLYHILYKDGDTEDYYQNEIQDLRAGVVKRHPKRKRQKKKTSFAIQKFAPINMELDRI